MSVTTHSIVQSLCAALAFYVYAKTGQPAFLFAAGGSCAFVFAGVVDDLARRK